MVRTRATTTPAATTERQEASEPAIGAVARGGSVARGRGRGRGRTSSRGRGRAPSPSGTRAVTPPPTEEVVREGEEGETEQMQNEELPPQPTPEMINQVLAYLSGLSDQGQAPPVFSAPTPPVSEVQHAATMAPRMDASLAIDTFPRLTTGPIMTNDQHELFSKFLKLKPPVFKGAESEDAYDFLVDCHELLHKMGIVERFGVEFVSYQFQGNAKMWWRSHVECQPTEAPPMTWASFSSLFMEKYIPRTLRDRKRDEFLSLEQGRMTVNAYEAKFRALSRYATQLCFSPQERIRRFVKGLRSELRISALQVAATAKSFQEVVDFVIEVEGVKPDDFTTTSTSKRFRKGGEFNGSYTRGQSSGGYSVRPIQSSLQTVVGGPPQTGQHFSERPMLESRECYGCGETGHIKRYCPKQSYRTPIARGRGGHGRGRFSGGRGGRGNGGHQNGRDDGQTGATTAQHGRGNGQNADRTHCYAFPGRSEAEASDAVITVLCKEAQQCEQKQRKKYTATLEQLSAFDVLLDEVYVDCLPKPSDYDARRDLLRIFNEIAKEVYGYSADAPVVEVFGSYSMDLFCVKSDLDLSVNFTNRKVNITREKKIQTLRKFAKKFYQLQRNGFVRGVNPVTTARVPVLKVVDRGTEIECDISVENQDGISKSKTIYMIGSIDERFRKLSFLMKAWAKAQNINSAKDQTLNSLSIILLVAFHLQTRNPPILPPFSALFKDGNDSVAVESSVCKFSNYGISNKESVAELFVSLLNKLLSVEKLWSEGLCASTFEGSWISRTRGDRVGRINVEDFADRSQNVARAVGAVEVKQIYRCIQLSVQHIFDFLNKKIGGNSLREFLFGQDVASKLAGAGTAKSGKKEVQSVALSKGNKKTVHVDSILTKSRTSVKSPRGMAQGKHKLLGPTDSSLTKRSRTDDWLGGTFSELSRRQPGEQPMPYYLANSWGPMSMISREAMYNRPQPVPFEPTYGRMRFAEHSGHPNLIAPAVPHMFPSRHPIGSQISYEPLRHPVGYPNSVFDSRQSSAYILPPHRRRF